MTDYQVPLEFSDPNGDIVLRSADDLDFRVYQVMLSKGSPIFEDMFHSPQPVVVDSKEVKDGLQVVHMEESSLVIGTLIQLCYPMEDPVIHTLRQLRPVLEAMVKYQMDKTRSGWIKTMLTSAVEQEPWGVYAIALTLGRISCHYPMEDEIRLAARTTIRHPVGGPWVEEMGMISTADYHRLLQYHRKCQNTLSDALALAKIFKNAGEDWVWMKPCNAGRCKKLQLHLFGDFQHYHVSEWWMTYRDRAKAALNGHPWGGVVEDEKLWADLVIKLFEDCPCCARAALRQVPVYVKKLAAAVEAELWEVKLEIKW